MDRPPITVRRATVADHPAAARILAAAFADDPVFRWMFPDPDDRGRLLGPVFERFVAAYSIHDELHVAPADGPVVAVALWVPPGAPLLEPADERRLNADLQALCGPYAVRMATCGAVVDAGHPDDPVWFLHYLGVEPGTQRSGLGSALVAERLAVADAAGLPAYLDATSPDNRRLYERHGFRCVREHRIPEGPPAYGMRRDAGG